MVRSELCHTYQLYASVCYGLWKFLLPELEYRSTAVTVNHLRSDTPCEHLQSLVGDPGQYIATWDVLA